MSDLAMETWNGLPVLKIKNNAAEAMIALLGAHVLSYKPAGGRELLWLSKETWHENGKSRSAAASRSAGRGSERRSSLRTASPALPNGPSKAAFPMRTGRPLNLKRLRMKT